MFVAMERSRSIRTRMNAQPAVCGLKSTKTVEMNFTLHNRQPPTRSRRKMELYKMLVARSDIDAARTSAELFLKTVRDIANELYYPLFTAIVICYARPFTNNAPYGALPNKWAKFPNEDLQDVHDSLMKARNEIVAHSDMSVRKAMIVPPGVVIGKLGNGKEIKSAGIGAQTNYYLFREHQIREVHTLTRDLGHRLNTEIDRRVAELYDGMELPATPFNLRIDEGL